MALGTINDYSKIILLESNGTTLDSLAWSPGTQFGEIVYISEVNGVMEVKSDAQVAMNKTQTPCRNFSVMGGWRGQWPNSKFSKLLELSETIRDTGSLCMGGGGNSFHIWPHDRKKEALPCLCGIKLQSQWCPWPWIYRLKCNTCGLITRICKYRSAVIREMHAQNCIFWGHPVGASGAI